MTIRSALVFTALAVLAAMPADLAAQRRQRHVITRDEILASPQKDADLYTAIKALRPHFLEVPRGTRTLGAAPMGAIAVYFDRIRVSGIDQLKNTLANTVEEVRYLDPTRSQNEYGITANAGAIVVKRFKTTEDSLRKPPR